MADLKNVKTLEQLEKLLSSNSFEFKCKQTDQIVVDMQPHPFDIVSYFFEDNKLRMSPVEYLHENLVIIKKDVQHHAS
ncbi:hypothetical protein [Bacillus sp. FJAT-42315]|uniref:hypothetical protein n=1 Tax=Bacillus sp. FJAT-42315 TaxID=2014077 RepID=UPI000BA90E2F|nr:hypothetical protein [Bacillus sp. FJAT-42315]PAQ14951.1 hypothetical protein CD798_08665 [Bacillaceae bacterium SAOS 7]